MTVASDSNCASSAKHKTDDQGLRTSRGIGGRPRCPRRCRCSCASGAGLLQQHHLYKSRRSRCLPAGWKRSALRGRLVPGPGRGDQQLPDSSVVAEAFERSTSLQYHSGNRWQGTVSIAGDLHGPFTLTARVTDINGTSVTSSLELVHDTPPVVTVTSPIQYSAARPTIRVTVATPPIRRIPAGAPRTMKRYSRSLTRKRTTRSRR
jgi:hypothetical protein